MEIAVVRPGEGLWQIAQRYGVSIAQITAANGLTDPNRLVPGMSLLIPADRVHVVRPGESLWRIALQYGTTVQAIAQLNGITQPNLIYPGQRLRIPRGARPVIEANAYEFNTGPVGVNLAREAAPFLTYISIFSDRVSGTGEITPLPAAEVVRTAHEGGAETLLTITNSSATRPFDSDIAHAFLGDPAAQTRALDVLIPRMRQFDHHGLNVDFEYVYPEDREAYNAFLRRAAPRLHAEGFTLSTALAPKVTADQPGLLYEAHDYPVHGEVCDFVILMTYEWGYVTGPPMAIAPLREVRRVLDYAVTAIPRNKILMGMPTYGRDWPLPYQRGVTRAETLSPVAATQRALRYWTPIQYDLAAQSPFYRYRDAAGVEHVVWFEDARSVQAKFDTVKEYGLRGVSYWVLGSPFPQNWLLLRDNFQVRKLR